MRPSAADDHWEEDASGSGSDLAVPRPPSVAWLLLAGIAWYQRSRLRERLHRRGSRCRFIPTCSEYGSRAVVKYGAVKGTALTMRRIYRCSSGFQGPYVDFP
jgi:putative membrane protein insertion efficiency factor